MFGLTPEKLMLIGVIAVILLGPERLPAYAAKLAHFIRTLKVMMGDAQGRLRDELGPDFDEVDWKQLDPRQYDPRRIIREALADEAPPESPAQPRAATTISPNAPSTTRRS